VLVGDSNAGQFTEPVIAAARQAAYNLKVATFSACPFVDGGVFAAATGVDGEAACRRFNGETLAELVRLKPGLVVTAARSDRYIEEREYRLREPGGELADTPDAKAGLWRRALGRTLALLARADIPVLVIHPIPRFETTPHECTTLSLLTAGCGSTVSVAAVDRRLRRAHAAETGAIAASVTASAMDLSRAICWNGVCATSRRGTILYRDRDHLSVEGSLTLSDEFRHAIMTEAKRDTLFGVGSNDLDINLYE
jgi:hypothetical protein